MVQIRNKNTHTSLYYSILVLNVQKVHPHVAEGIHAMGYTAQDKQKNKQTHTHKPLPGLSVVVSLVAHLPGPQGSQLRTHVCFVLVYSTTVTINECHHCPNILVFFTKKDCNDFDQYFFTKHLFLQ